MACEDNIAIEMTSLVTKANELAMHRAAGISITL
jgi:hypothetical protein